MVFAVALVSLLNVDLTENKKHKKIRDAGDYETSEEYAKFTNVFDLRGQLRKRFGFNAALRNPQSDAVCSPVSALLALGKLAIGAHGVGYTELNKAIGVKAHQSVDSDYEDYEEPSQDDRSLKRHMMGLIESLESLPNVTLDLANRLYVSEHKRIYKNFTKVATRIFNTAVEKTDFSNPSAAVASINNWVSFQTHGMITNLLQPNDIQSNASLVMVNAVYFSGTWKHTFEKVVQDYFYSPKGVKQMPMMTTTQWYNYVDSDLLNAHIVEIPYVGQRCAFIIVLPKKKNELALLLNQLKSKPHMLPKEMRRMQSSRITLTIPKFKIVTEWDLKNQFKKLGLRAIFKKSTSGLTGIIRNEQLEVSRAVQKVSIEVTETGTQGAAASAIVNLATMFLGGFNLRVDHPFLFYVLVNYQQLFAGIYN